MSLNGTHSDGSFGCSLFLREHRSGSRCHHSTDKSNLESSTMERAHRTGIQQGGHSGGAKTARSEAIGRWQTGCVTATLGRVFINRDCLARLTRCPLCPGSDQIPPRSESTRCVKGRHHGQVYWGILPITHLKLQRRRLGSRGQHGAGELRVRCAIATPARDWSEDAKERALHH
jgi:hypothetical protein